jgi:hypothetical protein
MTYRQFSGGQVMPDMLRPRFNATVVLPTFEIGGQIEPIGPWLDFLNNRDKTIITVYSAHVMPIGASTPPGPEQPQVHINRAEVCVICLPDHAAHESVYMLKSVQTAVVHIGPIVCRGELHIGADKTVATYVDELPGGFFPITNVELFSTIALPAPLPRKADLILANRAQLRLFYAA